jgi:hypothetical protein
MEIKTNYTKEEKIASWGEGEWVNEPDFIEFSHLGYTCRITRATARETDGSLSGGYLCGYVFAPPSHPLFSSDECKTKIECHGGVTHIGEDGIIGFDCAHATDLNPGLEAFRAQHPRLREYYEKHFGCLPTGSSAFASLGIHPDLRRAYEGLFGCIPTDALTSAGPFSTSYRNMEFCIQECKSIAEQLEKYKEK